jgi:hypothetical protein
MISTRALSPGRSYLDDAELPLMLKREEGYRPEIYADSKGIPTSSRLNWGRLRCMN